MDLLPQVSNPNPGPNQLFSPDLLESPRAVLNRSGATPENVKVLEKIREAFPEREARALFAWIGSFYGFQQNWLLDQSRYALLVKCRQIGASHTYAAAGLLWALLGEDTSIVSIGEREGTEVLKKVGRHTEALIRLGSVWARPKAASATRITLSTGGTVWALPATSGGRGQSGNALLDEAAYFEHPEEVWDGAAATIMHGYRMRVASTPNGVGNMFHSLVKNHEANGYRLHRVDLEEAQADGLRVSTDECRKMAKGDPRLFRQMFGCKFLDGNLQYIPSDLIDACSTDALETVDGPYYAGLDIGKTVDRTVLYVLRKVAGPAYVTAHVETHKRTDPDGLNAMVARAFERFNLRRLCLDETGIGAFPAMTMQKLFGRSKIEPITFTLQTKEDLATALYTAFAKQQVRIPKTKLAGSPHGEAERIFEDIASLRRIITPAGNVRYDAPHTDEGHADRAWALALALHAAMNAPSYAVLQ